MKIVGNKLTVELHFAKKKRSSQVGTIATHIRNMITGVTKGYRYKMKFVYAHFPINYQISSNNKSLEMRKFLGEKVVRNVEMLDGVTLTNTGNKDEIQLDGIDVEKVSKSCALIHASTLVKNKDIRKFLDGVYVSESGTIDE